MKRFFIVVIIILVFAPCKLNAEIYSWMDISKPFTKILRKVGKKKNTVVKVNIPKNIIENNELLPLLITVYDVDHDERPSLHVNKNFFSGWYYFGVGGGDEKEHTRCIKIKTKYLKPGSNLFQFSNNEKSRWYKITSLKFDYKNITILQDENQESDLSHSKVDSNPPVILIYDIKNGVLSTNNSKHLIRGKLDDENNITWLKINDRNVNVDQSGKFHYLASLSKGNNNFTIKASDTYDNISSETIRIKCTIKMGKLFVNTKPNLSKVRILNIKPKFYQGMKLSPGKYHIEVSHNDYKIYNKWIMLNSAEIKSMDIALTLLNNHSATSKKESLAKIIEISKHPTSAKLTKKIDTVKDKKPKKLDIINDKKPKKTDIINDKKPKKIGGFFKSSLYFLEQYSILKFLLKKSVNYFRPKMKDTKTDMINDKKPPEIVLSATSRGIKKVSKARHTIKGQAIDKSGVALVYVNSIEANLDEYGNFSADILLKPGENNVVIESMDIHNNKGNMTFMITRNKNFALEKKISLVIGNDLYANASRLNNSINDARAISKSLKKLGFEVMTYENVKQKTMKKAIDTFGAKLKNYDTGLFFYAGHGVQVDGYNFLIPIDAKLNSQNDVEYDCINVGRVLSKMEDADNKTNIIILDACRDNPFERSWMRGSKGKGLAFINAPNGSLIAYATSPGKTASDGKRKNGLYTSVLLEYINVPKITALQMFQRVRKAVIEKSSGKQTPWESTSLTDDFYFNKEVYKK